MINSIVILENMDFGEPPIYTFQEVFPLSVYC